MMKVSDYVNEAMIGGAVATYRLYEPVNGSDNYLIFLHGKGEIGLPDGSQLNLVETHGYPKSAAQGIEFPFNIVALQTDVNGFSLEKKAFTPHIKLKYKANKIIVTGLSMGGIGTYEFAAYDQYKLIDAIAPVCGKYPTTLAASYPDIPIFAFHGDKDTVVPYSADKLFIEEYNKTHETKAILRTYKDVGHNAWDYAYALNRQYDDPNLYQWILERFTDS